MKKNLLFISLTLSLIQYSVAQKQDIRERIYIQTNDISLISGETLGFSSFVISDLTQQLSNKSNFLYVELLNDKGSLFQQKLKLENGRASSSFFISSLIKTGNYKLIAYTRWMKNFDEYFQLPIEVINPFEEYIPSDTLRNLTIQMLPKYKNLIANVKNTICIKLINTLDEDYSGKLINEDIPEESFNFDKLGFACIEITPKANAEYKILVTNEKGDISIFPVTFNIDNGTKLITDENDKEIVININSSNSNDALFDLTLEQNNIPFLTQSVISKQTITIKKSDFAEGLIKATLKLDGQTIDECHLSASSNHYSSPILVKPSYQKRDSALVYLPVPRGFYSVSVKMIHDEFPNQKLSAKDSRIWFELDTLNNTPAILDNKALLVKLKPFKGNDIQLQEVQFLPESRNEFISGQAFLPNEDPYSNKPINLSLPGTTFQNNVITTDSVGKFTFHFRPDNFDRTAYISPLDLAETVDFKYEPKFIKIAPDKFYFSTVNLDSAKIINVKERSIRNQILNAYNIPNTNDSSLEIKSNWQPQINNYRLSYNFDDYKRFDNLKEHIIEYINLVSIRNGKVFLGELSVSVDSTNQLILLDGLPVDAKDILEINPYFIESVHIENTPIYLGAGVFSAVLLIKTKSGLLEGFDTNKYTKVEVKGMSNLAVLDDAWYSAVQEDNQPDFREQLYWNPTLEHKIDGSAKIKFRTSDIPGSYLLKVDGFSAQGEAISKSAIIKVE